MSAREANNGKFGRKLFLDIETQKSRQKFALSKIACHSKNNKDGWVHISKILAPFLPFGIEYASDENAWQNKNSGDDPDNEADDFHE
jgi:hypothetical protein